MTNEIKEIIKLCCEEEIEVKFFAKDDSLMGTYMDCDQLLDYITNLQNKLEEKTYLYNKLDTESKYAITNLQEENKRKERLITQYAEGMCAYANRIDKAVEYINHEWFKREQIGIAPLQFSYEELQNVLDILRGDE